MNEPTVPAASSLPETAVQPTLPGVVSAAEPEPSLADHEAQFGRDRASVAPTAAVEEPEPHAAVGDDVERDATGKFKPRHRAKSQQAGPADVPRIQELTKKLRESEAREAEAQAALKARTIPSTAPNIVAPPVLPALPAARPKPTEDQIGTTYQNYPDFIEALADWKVEQRELAHVARLQTRDTEQWQQQAVQAHQQAVAAHLDRMQAFIKQTPTWDATLQAAPTQMLTPVLHAAILHDPEGPSRIFFLAQHADVFDELQFLSDGKPVTPDSVAAMQRLLKSRMPTVTTGAVAAPVSVPVAPRPPTPVRTGPMRTGDEPPGEDASIAEHERFYGRARRRA